MPVHDWTRVEAGIFHAFHVAWLPEISKILNGGLLPEDFYALAEQHAGRSIADVLTLHAGSETDSTSADPLLTRRIGPGTAVAEVPPRVRHRETHEGGILLRRRTLSIRHISGHRLVAIIEILSPANKDRARSVNDFAAKMVDALDHGIHVFLVDLFPPGPNDPHGIHDVIRRRLALAEDTYDLPTQEPLTIASYSAGTDVEIYLEHLAVGAALPEMPLFLLPDRYINVPLESTYQEAYRGMPAFWRDVLEGRSTSRS